MQHTETIIIGAGQAGLATSYWLQQAGRDHLILEKTAMPASAWKTGRWDSFALVTPNWTLNMPGAPVEVADRSGFLSLPEIVDYFDHYVEHLQPTVRYNTAVSAVRPRERGGYDISASGQQFRAEHVVIATGFEQSPRMPGFASHIDRNVIQLHSSQYRNPESLPPGAVLVVGSAQSGAQIAEELYQKGRVVYLSVSGAGRALRRYRGQDGFDWLWRIGFFDIPRDKFPGDAARFAPPHLSGTNGGHTLNLHQFAREGVHLLGHVQDAAGTTLQLAPDFHENLAKGDGFEAQLKQMIDGFILKTGIDAPPEEIPVLRYGYDQPQREILDLEKTGIRSIVWATGYEHDFSMIDLPVTDEHGFLIGDLGVTPYPGLYCVGMLWMPSIKPATLAGVADSARYVAEAIVDRVKTVAAA